MKRLLLFAPIFLLMGASSSNMPGGEPLRNNTLQGYSPVYFRFTPTDQSGFLMNACPKLRITVTSNIADNADHDGTFNIYECPGWATARSATISAITKAASAVVSSEGHTLAVGHIVKFSGVVGMTEINGELGTVTAVTPGTPDTFTVDIDSQAFSDYTSGGTASLLVYSSLGCKLREIRDSSNVQTPDLTGNPNTGLDSIYGLTSPVIAIDADIAANQTGEAELRCIP